MITIVNVREIPWDSYALVPKCPVTYFLHIRNLIVGRYHDGKHSYYKNFILVMLFLHIKIPCTSVSASIYIKIMTIAVLMWYIYNHNDNRTGMFVSKEINFLTLSSMPQRDYVYLQIYKTMLRAIPAKPYTSLPHPPLYFPHWIFYTSFSLQQNHIECIFELNYPKSKNSFLYWACQLAKQSWPLGRTDLHLHWDYEFTVQKSIWICFANVEIMILLEEDQCGWNVLYRFLSKHIDI